MRTSAKNHETTERDQQLLRALLNIQIELEDYQKRKGNYNQQLLSEVDAIMIHLDLLAERILQED